MEITTINRKQDKRDFCTYTQLNNVKVILEEANYLTLEFDYGKLLKVHKKNLLRVLTPYGCYIKKWLLKY